MGAGRMIGRACAAAVFALALGVPAAAQQREAAQRPEAPPAPARAEAVVVTATRTPVPAGGETGSVDVVSRAQIEAAAAADLKAALALVPSVVFNDSGGPGGVATLSLRGSTSQQVLVLLDGQRLANAQSSFFNLNDLPVPIERIERIEVVRTPASALYGADALGGVVNIITRPAATTPELRLSYGRGTDAEERIGGGAQYGFGKLGLRADGRLHRGDGHRENADFDLKNVALTAAVAPAPWGLDVRYTKLERDAGVPGPAAFPSPHARQSDDRQALRAGFSYLPGGSWDVRAGVFTEEQTLDYEDPDPPDFGAAPSAPVASRHENDSHGVDAQWNLDTGRGELFTLGGEMVWDGIDSTNDGEHDTDRWGVWVQDQWRMGGWSAVLAIRHDKHSVYGDETSPSVSGAWQGGGWKIWGSWARGYRAPNFDDLYWDEPFLQGNPDLEPETAQSYEGGLQLAGAGGHARVSLFRREVSKLIRWADDDGDFVFRPENIDRALITGVEGELLYRPATWLEIPVGIEQVRVEDDETGERLPGSVRSTWRAGLRSAGRKLAWSVEYSGTDRGEFLHKDGSWTYRVLNAGLAWKGKLASLQTQVSVRGENLLDREYETVEGYPMPGRTFFVEARIGL